MEVWRYTYALYRVYRTMHCVQTYALRTDLYTVCIDLCVSICGFLAAVQRACAIRGRSERCVAALRSCIA